MLQNFAPGYDLLEATENPDASVSDYLLGILGIVPGGKGVGKVPDALKYLEDILRPGGKLIGDAGSSPGIRNLPGDIKAAEDLTLDLGKAGQLSNRPYDPNGVGIDLLGGGFIGFRPASRSGGPAIDINVQGFEDVTKIHFK